MSNIRRNLSLFLTVTLLITIYLLPNEEESPNEIVTAPAAVLDLDDEDDARGGDERRRRRVDGLRNIVAYSLMKQIEVEGNYQLCSKQHHHHQHEEKIDFNHIGIINNNKWYRLQTSEFFVYSVHVDGRLAPYNYIRIIGMAKGNWNETLYCNFLTSNANLKWTKARKTILWSSNWLDEYNEDNYMPHLISCQLPSSSTTTTTTNEPIKLYLNKGACETTSGILIYSNDQLIKHLHHLLLQQPNEREIRKKKHRVTICVKPMDFKRDIARRLIEWIELNKLLGADLFHFYVKNVHRNVHKLLLWYQAQHPNVHLTFIEQLNATHSNLSQKRKYEILTYNDCFYKSLTASNYVLPLDIDEIIVPRHNSTWHDLLARLPKNYASYAVRNAYYLLKSVRKRDVFFLQTFLRTKYSDVGESVKSFISTENALSVFNHYALDVLKPDINKCYFISDRLAQLNHYRYNCSIDLLPECVKYISSPRIYDDIVLKYKDIFFRNYNNVVEQLSYL